MYSIQPLTDQRYSETLDFVCREFVAGSVLHRVSGISPNEYSDYLRTSFHATVMQGLSFIAVEEPGKRIDGCIMAGEFSPDNAEQSAVPDKFKPMNALLSELESVYRKQRVIVPGAFLLVDIAVVSSSARGGGIYTRMRETVQLRGKDRGYRYVIGELSSAATQYLCREKMGHRLIAEINYRSFQYQGTFPFAAIEDPPSIQLLEGSLE